MTEIVPFDFEGTAVRVLTIDGEPWWVAGDVTRVLGYRLASDAVRWLDDDEKGTQPVRTPGGVQNALVVNEPGLYSLILRSKIEEAKRFKRWVTHEVIPSIRRTGRYEVAPAPAAPAALMPSHAEALRGWADALEQQQIAVARVAELEPSARSFDVLAAAHGDYSVAGAASILNRDENIHTGRDRLFVTLEKFGWIYRERATRRWVVYQKAVDAGRVVGRIQKPFRHPRTGLSTVSTPQVRVTVKGIHDLHRRLGGIGPIDLYIAEAPPEEEEEFAGAQMMLLDGGAA
ncbi:phage antirepressor KilAC domain-containing protein [Frankia sp. Mgl5]|uniref:phage antirepressor n=1 Tax=Frankia sp. Mgl5 TaxID=2933793 RepID=UPI00200E3AC7|nr:BRO family protein [Frankia sp. Mgl5]MCK9928116.1 phage antirepressor KilAC domain-containing protein [Frankia sp. Mgl5]